MRNIVADRLKSFLMFLVVLGHVIYFWNGSFYFNSRLYANNIIAELIRTVQMPCFMIVSGFFFNKAVNKYSFISRQYKRTILFRYIISDLVVIFTWSNLYFCSKGILNVNIRYYIDFLRTSFWFFWVLLFLKITFTFIHYVGKDSIIWVIILFIGFLCIPMVRENNFTRFTAQFPYFMTGYYAAKGKWEDKIIFSIRQFILLIVTWGVLWCFGQVYLNNYDISISREIVNLYGIICLSYSFIIKIAAFVILYNVMYYISSKVNKESWGGNTIIVYPLHIIIIHNTVWGTKIFKEEIITNHWLVSVRSIILAIAIYILCNGIAKLSKKSRVLRILCWGKIDEVGK